MTALTNEIIGLVLVVVVIVIALAVRGALSGNRSQQRPRTQVAPNSEIPHPERGHAGRGTSVTSAFGSAPVWAGGSPTDSWKGSVPDRPDGADRRPHAVPPPFPPRPAPSTRPAPPPSVSRPVPSESVPGPIAEPGPPRQPVPGPPRDTYRLEGASGTSAARVEPRDVEVVAVAGNSAHPSVVMHVSSLRPPVARGIPTDWMVVTPMDLLGDPPPRFDGVEQGVRPAGEKGVPIPEVGQPAASVSTPFLPDEADQPVPPPLEEPVLDAPNPFGPAKAQSSQVDLGMPSSLLVELLGSQDPPEHERRTNAW